MSAKPSRSWAPSATSLTRRCGTSPPYATGVWLLAALAGGMCVATGYLPWHDAVATTQRVGPILGFLVAITVVAELADAAHVFDVAAVRAARTAKGRTPLLFAMVLLLGALTTIVLSLDTTAVLLTPVVLAMATRLRLSPVPFAMAAVWLANTASLLLPVSNLSNLLAVDRVHMSATEFANRMWLPALLSLLVSATVLGFGIDATCVVVTRSRGRSRCLTGCFFESPPRFASCWRRFLSPASRSG